MKFVSTSRKVQIIFDFKSDSIERLDPTKNRNILGTTYFKEHYIYIGAKGLLSEFYCQALGVMTHEFCHFAMSLLYDNKCKPYRDENQAETKKSFNEQIDLVFSAPDTNQHAELIVRVLHLTALYKDDTEKHKTVSETFKELFQYYEENTLVDLLRDYPLMVSKQELIQFTNGILETLQHSDIEFSPNGLKINLNSNDKFLYISSNCSQLTIHAIYQQYKIDIDCESIIIVDLKVLQKDSIFHFAVEALKLYAKPKLIINCSGQKVDEVKKISQKFFENQINRGIVFVFDQKQDLLGDSRLEVKHSWSHLTGKFQEKTMQRKIKFQGKKIQLKDLIPNLRTIDEIPFNKLIFSGETITIAKIEENESFNEFVSRKFLSPNSRKLNRYSENYNIEHDFTKLLHCVDKNRTVLLSDIIQRVGSFSWTLKIIATFSKSKKIQSTLIIAKK